MPTIKRGVSLYSFQEEYFLGKLDVEGCLRSCPHSVPPAWKCWASRCFPASPTSPIRKWPYGKVG